RRTRLAYRHVHVGAQVALLHVAVAGAEIAHDGTQLRDVGLGLLGGAQIRLRHDLHERHARAVEVDEGRSGMPVVQRFSGVLFKMQPLDPDLHGLAVGQIDDDLALAHERRFVLADLIALRQIGIKVVLAVDTDFRLIRALSPRPVRTACLMHSSLITGSMPGMAASTSDTCELGSPPNAVEAPEKSFAREVTWAWTSMPITTSQSPVAPFMNFDFISGASINALQGAPPALPHAHTWCQPPLAILVKCFGHAPQGCRNCVRAHPPQEPRSDTGVGLSLNDRS